MKIIIRENQYRKLVNESYLSPDQYNMIGVDNVEELNALRTERLWDNIFGNEDKIYIPYELSQEDIDISNKNIVDSKEYNTIKDVIKDVIRKKYGIEKDITADEYRNNLISFEIKNEFTTGSTVNNSISKILNRVNPELLVSYNNDKNRISSKQDKLLICISRDPIDVVTMSSNRGWTSCLNIVSGNTQYSCLPHEIENGTCVAYLIRENDKEIKNPLARVAIRTYYNVNNPNQLVLYTSKKTYPANFNNFREQVHDYISDKMGDINIKHVYNLRRGSHRDDPESQIGMFMGKKSISNEVNWRMDDITTVLMYTPKSERFDFLKKLEENKVDYIKLLNGDNLHYIGEYLTNEENEVFIKYVLEKKPSIITTLNSENINNFLIFFPEKERFKKLKEIGVINPNFNNTIKSYNIANIIKKLPESERLEYINELEKGNTNLDFNLEDIINIIVILPENDKKVFLNERYGKLKKFGLIYGFSNIEKIFKNLSKKYHFDFINKLINNNKNFFSESNLSNFGSLLKEFNFKSDLLNIFTKKEEFIKNTPNNICYLILLYSKRPISLLKRLPKEKRLLIKNFSKHIIKDLTELAVNKESVNKLLKHYNMI